MPRTLRFSGTTWNRTIGGYVTSINRKTIIVRRRAPRSTTWIARNPLTGDEWVGYAGLAQLMRQVALDILDKTFDTSEWDDATTQGYITNVLNGEQYGG